MTFDFAQGVFENIPLGFMRTCLLDVQFLVSYVFQFYGSMVEQINLGLVGASLNACKVMGVAIYDDTYIPEDQVGWGVAFSGRLWWSYRDLVGYIKFQSPKRVFRGTLLSRWNC